MIEKGGSLRNVISRQLKMVPVVTTPATTNSITSITMSHHHPQFLTIAHFIPNTILITNHFHHLDLLSEIFALFDIFSLKKATRKCHFVGWSVGPSVRQLV